jgi:hypothetical protein
MKKTNVIESAPKSKFTLSSLEVSACKSGERVSNDVIPTIETSSQLNKFRINKMASELMNVVAGNRVKIFTTSSDDINGKYLLVVAADEAQDAAKLASPTKAKGHSVQQFNYAGVWSKIAQGTADAQEKSGAALVEEGVAVQRASAYYLDHKTVYELVEVDNFNDENPLVDPATNAQYTSVFTLINPKFIDVDLTKEVKDEEDATDAKDVTDVKA